MLLKNKLYVRKDPTKDAKLIIIYCEGKKREKDYFNYFIGISSRIRLEVEPPTEHDNNSPLGLYDKTKLQLFGTDDTPPKYELLDHDEIWFVIDTDTWGNSINELRRKSINNRNWFVAQSNPCFEVWLLYHFNKYQEFEGMDISANWKNFLNTNLSGGFDSRKHPVHIYTAITNSKEKYESEGSVVNIGCTEVFKLAESIYPLVAEQIKEALSQIKT